MKQCNQCNANLPDEAVFCTNCGNKIAAAEIRKCPQCQEEYHEGDRFCNNCGEPLAIALPTAEEAAANKNAANDEKVQEEAAENTDGQDEFDLPAETEELEEPETAKTEPQKEVDITEEEIEGKEDSQEEEIEDKVDPQEDVPIIPVAAQESAAQVDPTDESPQSVPVADNSLNEPKRRFCSQCGSEFGAGAVFCRGCGYNLNFKALHQAAIPPQQTAYTGHAYSPYAQTPPSWQQPAPQPVKKKKKKGWLVALIIVLVVVLAGGATYIFAGRTIRRMIMGNKAAYIALEGEQLRRNASDMVEMLVDMGNQRERSEIGGQVVELQFDLSDNLQFIDPSTLAVLENITWRTRTLYDRQGGSSRYFAGLDILAGNEELLKIEGYYDENQLIVGLPGLLDKFIWAQGSELDELTEDLDIGDVNQSMSMVNQFLNMDLDIDEPELKRSLHRIIDIVLDHIDEAEFESRQTLRVGQVMNEYDKYTITIGQESARQMMIKIFEVLRVDREIYSLANEFIIFSMTMDPYAYEYSDYYEEDPITWDEWQSNLESLINELENYDEDEEFTIVQSIYVDSDDQIVGRDIIFIDDYEDTVTHIRYYNPVQDDQEARLLQIETEEEIIELRNIYSRRDDKLSGRLTFTVDSQEYLLIDYSDYQKFDMDGRSYILGDFTIKVSEPDAGMPTTINYRGSMVQNQFVMNLGIPDFGSIKVGYQEIAPGEVDFPTYQSDILVSVSDTEGLYGLITEDVMERLYSIAMELGFMPDDMFFN